MTNALAPKEPVRLSYEDRQMKASALDLERFLLSAEKAANAFRNGLKDDERIALFQGHFLLRLHSWCVQNADRVAACYLPLAKRYLQVFIVTRNSRFDFPLSENIATLEREFATQGWRLGIVQLPASTSGHESSLSTFFNLDGALEVYAQRESTRDQGVPQS